MTIQTFISKRKTLLGFIAGTSLAAAAVTFAAAGSSGGHEPYESLNDLSGAAMSTHVDHMLKHLYVEVDATDAQKAQIGPLVHQAVSDLVPMRAQLQAAHAQVVAALTATSVDRNALESARQEHLQLADQASKRLSQLIADVAEVLTPAQRLSLADHLRQMRHHREF